MIRYLSVLLIIGSVCSNLDEDCFDIYASVCEFDGVSYGNDC